MIASSNCLINELVRFTLDKRTQKVETRKQKPRLNEKIECSPIKRVSIYSQTWGTNYYSSLLTQQVSKNAIFAKLNYSEEPRIHSPSVESMANFLINFSLDVLYSLDDHTGHK